MPNHYFSSNYNCVSKIQGNVSNVQMKASLSLGGRRGTDSLE